MTYPRRDLVFKFDNELLIARSAETGGHHFLNRSHFIGSAIEEIPEPEWWKTRRRETDPAEFVNELIRCKDLYGLYSIAQKYGMLIHRIRIPSEAVFGLHPHPADGARLCRDQLDVISVQDLTEPSMEQISGELYFNTDRDVRAYPNATRRALNEHALHDSWTPNARVDENMSSEPISDWITLRGILQALGRVYVELAKRYDNPAKHRDEAMAAAGFAHYSGGITWCRTPGQYHDDNVDYTVEYPSNEDIYQRQNAGNYNPADSHWFMRKIGNLSPDMLAVAEKIIGQPVAVASIPSSRYYSYEFAGKMARIKYSDDTMSAEDGPSANPRVPDWNDFESTSYGMQADLLNPGAVVPEAVDRLIEAGQWLEGAFPLLSRMCDTCLSEVCYENGTSTSVDFAFNLPYSLDKRDKTRVHFVFGCQALSKCMELPLDDAGVYLAIEVSHSIDFDYEPLSNSRYDYLATMGLAEFAVAYIKKTAKFSYNTMVEAALCDDLKLGEIQLDISWLADEAIASIFGHAGRKLVSCTHCGRISLAPAHGKPRQFCSASCQHMHAQQRPA